MDLRAKGFYGQLRISGIAEPINIEGSVMDMLRQFMTELTTKNPQRLKNGKEITIKFCDRVIENGLGGKPEDDIFANIDVSDTVPLEGESYEQYYLRLITQNLPHETAKFYADDWFDMPQDFNLASWMNDKVAQRFVELNSSREAFDTALPSEYEELKQYVLTKYPERSKRMTFRTA